MKVYLDDDMDSNVLIGLLKKAGHDGSGNRPGNQAGRAIWAAAEKFLLQS